MMRHFNAALSHGSLPASNCRTAVHVVPVSLSSFLNSIGIIYLHIVQTVFKRQKITLTPTLMLPYLANVAQRQVANK